MNNSKGIQANKRKSIIFVIALTLAGCLIYAISAGIRSNYGIMLQAISSNSGIPYASVSFVLAVAQLVFGIMQPVFGIAALKKSNVFVLCCGVICTAGGLLIIPFCGSVWMLMIFLGIVLPSGTGALSFGIIMGAITPRMSENQASSVSGIVNASSGVGNSILSPVIQSLIAAGGLMGAMVFLSIPTIILMPVSIWMCRSKSDPRDAGKTLDTKAMAEKSDGAFSESRESVSVKRLFLNAFKNRTYRFLLMGFFTCGFFMAIIETHLYTQITGYGLSGKMAAYAFSVYGIATIIGSVISGMLCSRIQMKKVLGSLYGMRFIVILVFLLLPKNMATVCVFTAMLGLLGNSTVPPTSGLVSRTFGAAKLATLFGFVFFVHQIGSFFSVWLGGICVSRTGSYQLLWAICGMLCVFASIVSFLIREPANMEKI